MISIAITLDFDECSIQSSPCYQNRNGTNSGGSFSCICNKDLLEMAALFVKVWGYISVKSNPPPPLSYCFVVVVVVGSLVIFNTLDQSCLITFAFKGTTWTSIVS